MQINHTYTFITCQYSQYLKTVQSYPMMPNTDPEQFWKQSSLNYKFCCITSTIILTFSFLIPAICIFFMDVPALTIMSFQIWRLFVSMLAQIPSPMSIISILFSFLWIYNQIDDRKYSTVYRFFEIIIINFEVHLLFNVISFFILLIFGQSENTFFFGFGWFPLIVVYEFRMSAEEPQGQRRLCCLPFLIKNKYYPWVVLLLLGLLSSQFVCFVASGIVGYYQEVIRKDMIVKLPISFYRKVDSWMPQLITNRSDYVSVEQAKGALASKCCGSIANIGQHQQANNNINNPFERNNNQPPQISNFSSPAAAVGGNPRVDFKNYWANKDNNEQSTDTNNNNKQKQVQIEPAMQGYQNTQTSSHSYSAFKENDSYAKFNDENQHGQGQYSQQNGEKKKKKKGTGQGNSDDLL